MTLKGGLAPALTAAALSGKPPQYLESVILDGRPGTPMPPWRKFIKPQEVRWLVKQLQSGDVNREND
jgi:cytochrome c55X